MRRMFLVLAAVVALGLTGCVHNTASFNFTKGPQMVVAYKGAYLTVLYDCTNHFVVYEEADGGLTSQPLTDANFQQVCD